MVRTYLKIAWRNLRKQPAFAAINLLGLGTGICFTLLISVFIWQENNVNKPLLNLSHQYILQSEWKKENLGLNWTSLGALPLALKENYPHLVANYYRFDGISGIVHIKERSFRQGIAIGDSSLLSMYGFEVLYGNPSTALTTPFSLVLSEDLALRFFGRKDVLNETIELENFNREKKSFQVTGVTKRIARNSVTNINDDNNNQLFISTEQLEFFGRNMNWDNPFIACYLELKPGVKPADLETPMKNLIARHATPTIANNLRPYLLPLEVYYQAANNNAVRTMNWVLGAIGAFIMLMAIINFINLTISRSTTRLKEVGVRLVMGSGKKQLRVQFLLETIVLVTISMGIALIGYWLLEKSFAAMIGKSMPPLTELPLYWVGFPILLCLLVGLLAGLYPAFYLAALPVAASLKNQLTSIKEQSWIRRGLVAVQFATAAIVLIGAVVVTQQVNYFFSKQLGYDKDYILTVQVPRNWSAEGVQQMLSIKTSFEALPQVQSASLSYDIPTGSPGGNITLFPVGADSSLAASSQLIMCDAQFAKTYGIPMAAGQFFSEERSMGDSTKLVINKAKAKILGWPTAEDALGQQVRVAGSSAIFTIAGVVNDVHLGSMQEAIQPQTYLPVSLTKTYRYFSFKLYGGNLADNLQLLEKTWQARLPGAPFDYNFLDSSLENLYKTELQLKKAGYTALALSIVLVLLGITGLVSISLQKRVKEIGVRKVLGASSFEIIRLFLKEFIGLALISTLLACPVAWILLRKWLNEYAYRINLSALPFLFGILGLVMVTCLLITAITYRQSQSNPAKSVRSE